MLFSQVHPTHEWHRIVCACGRQSYSGDRHHHVTRESLRPCACGKPGFAVVCPPGCDRGVVRQAPALKRQVTYGHPYRMSPPIQDPPPVPVSLGWYGRWLSRRSLNTRLWAWVLALGPMPKPPWGLP